MKKSNMRTAAQQKYLIDLGRRIEKIIILSGYNSVYDFWVQTCGDNGLSRSALNYIIAGQTDPKITTLKTIAESLGVDLHQLIV